MTTTTDADAPYETLRRELEDARARLAECERRAAAGEEYRTFLERAPAPLFAVNLEGQYLYVNRAFAAGLGRTAEQVIGKRLWDIFAKDLADERFAALSTVARTGEPKVINVVVPLPDGERHFVTTITPLLDPAGAVTAVLCASQDYTDTRQTERALHETNDALAAQLLHAQKMESVGRLAGGVAHDFNNMLSVIVGNAALALEDTSAESPVRENLLQIRAAATRSADLTRQLLAFARKQAILPKVLDLNATVLGLLKMLGRLIGEDVRVEWLQGRDLWPIFMDSTQLDQALVNLCVNARDAITGPGCVTLETANVVLDEAYCATRLGAVPGDYVRVSISDDGCGMDAATLAQIFEPFFTTKPPGEGTGLGLSTVYGIVQQNGGVLDVHRDAGDERLRARE